MCALSCVRAPVSSETVPTSVGGWPGSGGEQIHQSIGIKKFLNVDPVAPGKGMLPSAIDRGRRWAWGKVPPTKGGAPSSRPEKNVVGREYQSS
jgi:hypothetical protein